MRRLILFTFLILFALNSIAQKDSSKTIRMICVNPIKFENLPAIKEKRALLLKEFETGNMEEVSNMIKKYKNEFDDNLHKFLTLPEECLLYYNMKNFSYLKNTISNLKKDHIILFQLKKTPEDSLHNIIMQKALENEKSIKNDIFNSDLSQEDKNFFVVYLNYLLKPENTDDNTKASKEFLKKYRRTKYKSLIKQNMLNLRPKISYYELSYGAFAGYGILSNKLRKNFSNVFTFGMDGDFKCNNYLLSLRLGVGLNNTKRELIIDDIFFEEDYHTNYITISALAGHNILKKSSFVLTPLAGVGYNLFTLNKEINDKIENGKIHGASYTLGLNLDFNIRKVHSIRLRFEYNTLFSNDFNNNSTLFFTIGFILKGNTKITQSQFADFN